MTRISFSKSPGTQSEQMPDGTVVSRTLWDCGLRLVTEKVPAASSCVVGFSVPIGSRDENTQEHGASHFLEHLLFKGTSKMSAREIALSFDRIGADFNAETAKEQTLYYTRVRNLDLDMAIDTLAHMITDSVLDPSEFELERGVILEEIAASLDDPMNVLWEEFYSRHFKGSIAHAIAGTKESISAMRRDEVWEFYQKRYRPNALVVTICGDVDHEDAKKRLEDRLTQGGWNLTALATPIDRVGVSHNTESYQNLNELSIAKKQVDQLSFILGTQLYEATSQRRFAFSVMNHILGGGMSSRLFQKIREEHGLAYSVYSFFQSHSDCGFAGVSASTSSSNAPLAIKLIKDELLKLANEGVTDTELRDAISHASGAAVLSMESKFARMRRLAASELIFGEFVDIDESLSRLKQVTAMDVRNSAINMLETSFTKVAIGPVDHLTDEQFELFKFK